MKELVYLAMSTKHRTAPSTVERFSGIKNPNAYGNGNGSLSIPLRTFLPVPVAVGVHVFDYREPLYCGLPPPTTVNISILALTESCRNNEGKMLVSKTA